MDTFNTKPEHRNRTLHGTPLAEVSIVSKARNDKPAAKAKQYRLTPLAGALGITVSDTLGDIALADECKAEAFDALCRCIDAARNERRIDFELPRINGIEDIPMAYICLAYALFMRHVWLDDGPQWARDFTAYACALESHDIKKLWRLLVEEC